MLFLFSGCQEYHDHYVATHGEYSSSGYISDTGTSSLIILPSLGEKDALVERFDNAKERIWVEIYTWTERDTLSALLSAHQRGVDTRVILEGNVYGTPRINIDTYNTIKEAGIPIVFANNHNYAFTHAKYWILDDTYCVSSGNLTYSSFQKNRDIIICDDESPVLDILETIFLADMAHELPVFSGSIPLDIGISPLNMRSRIVEMILSAEKEILVYVQDISDHALLTLLDARARSGIDVTVCVADNDSYNDFSSYTFRSHIMKKPYLHAKALVIDRKSFMVGSPNFSENALDRNREIALFSPNDTKSVHTLTQLFFEDCMYQKFAK